MEVVLLAGVIMMLIVVNRVMPNVGTEKPRTDEVQGRGVEVDFGLLQLMQQERDRVHSAAVSLHFPDIG